MMFKATCVCLFVLNATFNIFQLYPGGQFYWWGKPVVKVIDKGPVLLSGCGG
jgi:hypothetical protein